MTEDARTFATLDACSKCGGVFAEPGESRSGLGHQAELTELSRRGLADMVGPSPIACPSGHGPMVVYRVRGAGEVELDMCSVCAGVFFDAGETELLKHLVEHVGEVVTASGARFSAPPVQANSDQAIAEARAHGGTALERFMAGLGQALTDMSRHGTHRYRRRW